MTDKVMIFVDGSNFFWAIRDRGLLGRLKYDRLRDFLVGSRYLVRGYYYCAARVPPTDGQRKFHYMLRHLGFEVVVKNLVIRKTFVTLASTRERVEGFKEEEKGVDVALATDLLSMGYKNAYDTAIVVGADADLQQVFEEVKRIPRRVEIAAFSDTDIDQPPRYFPTVSREMKMLPDRFVPLEDHIPEIC